MKRYVSLASALLVGTVLAHKEKTFTASEVTKAAPTSEIKAVQDLVLESKKPNQPRKHSAHSSQTSGEKDDLTSNGTSSVTSNKVRAASPTSERTSVES